ncbi:IclR family transcriptional regulator [Arsenicitalea aurantiaca]|uniref:IclR family transcriptional regulator n=1 Tax=Arsenicitalea aurantiaca TaxID=1783274 RepID=A0A433X2J1_9HYPH|nr:IclR family transcriptional regulator [Arsenicitalea aurantiaca]RUT28305.1 IclR family transcriptional regulator [Arsenicitalea aurantiaca]
MPGNSAGVAAVERAVSLLEAFTEHDRSLTLGELSRRVALDKATVLRIARSLAKSHMLVRNEDASWRLGHKLVQLGALYQSTFNLTPIVEPLLAKLSDDTGESAAVYAREGDMRICLHRHDSKQAIRHSARVGNAFALDKGAPGHVILAFSGQSGELYDLIRQRGYHATFGERDPEVSSLSVPLFRDGAELFGSIAITGPTNRFTEESIERNMPKVKAAAAQISQAMGGRSI